jgi:neurofibromin 1
MLDQNPAWNEICVLARINLMLSFTPANPLGAQLFLPELIHIITLLVGIGPFLVRQTIYGLFINLLQSMASSKATDEMNATTLQQALDKAQLPVIMRCFGLVQLGSGLESLEEGTSKEESENSRLDRVETLAKFMGEILVAAAPSPGKSSCLCRGVELMSDCANAWRARWMGLVVGTCFQHNPATQPQAFTILGYLASDEVDDDLVYQVLVAMSTTLSHLSDTDTVLLTSMLRCLSRIIPGLLPDSRYATSLFWLAFAVAEMGYIPLFGTALELMHTALKALDGDERVDRVMDHLLEFRHSMGEPARKIDQIAGISFEQEPSFGIIGILFKGFRHPSTRKAAIDVALELLRLTTHHTGPVPEDEAALIPKSSVAYFVALLPVLAGDVDELKNLFIAAGLEVKDESLMDLGTLSVLSVLSIP